MRTYTPGKSNLSEQSWQYDLDAHDRIVSIGPGWSEFALENQAPAIAATGDVVGRPIWDYIHDEGTRDLYAALFAVARSGREIVVPFRCDAPTLKRYMVMSITSLADRGLRLTSTMLRSETRPYQPLLDPAARRSDEWVTVCAWCKRARIDDLWIEIDEATARWDAFGDGPVPRLTHGVCYDCYKNVMHEVEAAKHR